MTSQPLVDFIVIGVQKAGTTALYDYLAEDSQLGLSDVKEVHFFDDETLDWSAPDYGPYHAHFPMEGVRLRGEATPIYVYWPGSLERIRAYNPAIRLVLLLRDPVERAWSHWRMETGRGAERAPFAWCVRRGRQRLFQGEPWGHHREFSYVERGFYGAQVARLYDLFPREQVLILKAEDLRADPDPALARVRRFLGLAASGPVTPREAHVGREMEGLAASDIAWLKGIYARDQARLLALTGLQY